MWFGPDCTSLFPHLSMFVALPDLPLHTQDILLARGGGGEDRSTAAGRHSIKGRGGPPSRPDRLVEHRLYARGLPSFENLLI